MGVGVTIAWDRFKKDFSKVVNQKLKEQAKTITELTADKFVELARNNLLTRANPKDSASQAMVNSIAQGITYTTTKDGKAKVIIPKGHDNLTMYLEYGTGLKGKQDPNPDALASGWNYDSENRGTSPFYFRKDQPQGRAFIYSADENPSFITSTKRYVSKKTGEAKTYAYLYEYDNWVKSRGIHATSFIYDAKISIKSILNKKYNTKGYKKALEQLH